MTTAILSDRGTATLAYSHARMQIMDRANRITRVMFSAKRKGNRLTINQAAEIVDSEIDANNISTVAVAVVNSAAQTLARVVRTTKIARLMFTGITAVQAAKIVDTCQTEAMTVVSFAGIQAAANDSTNSKPTPDAHSLPTVPAVLVTQANNGQRLSTAVKQRIRALTGTATRQAGKLLARVRLWVNNSARSNEESNR